jgi:hypothetical protein
MSTSGFEIPVAHIDDPESIRQLESAYRDLHDDLVRVTVGSWSGTTSLKSRPGRTAYRFVISAHNAGIELRSGDTVRGGISESYESSASGHSSAIVTHQEEIWPGDALTSNDQLGSLELVGSGVYFEVDTESTDYPAPKVSLLRNLGDHPGGCAAYDQAFRRETLPPAPIEEHSRDRIGSNRVNEHTLDMRHDRDPGPSRHHHGTVVGANGQVFTHTEAAIVLDRSTYGLPEVGSNGRAVIFRDPVQKGTEDSFSIPIRPGSIVVTPSTPDRLYGHCFENAFAMLVAIPGFVAPYEMIP